MEHEYAATKEGIALIISQVAGLTIAGIEIRGDDTVAVSFDNGTVLEVRDDGQDCCEIRYITSDDDGDQYRGAIFNGFDIGSTEYREHGRDSVHEVAFLNIRTSLGVYVAETHNEHNGYYGGFEIALEEVKQG